MRERNLAHKLGAVTPPCSGCHMEDICGARSWTCQRFRIWATDPNAKGARGSRLERGYHMLSWEESWQDEPVDAPVVSYRPDGVVSTLIPAAQVVDADLVEAAAGYNCSACGRPETECSVSPCLAVVRDRGEAGECAGCGFTWTDDEQFRCPCCGGRR